MSSTPADLAVCLITNVLLSAGTIVFGIVVSLAFCWQVGMVMLAAMPIIAAGHVLRNKFEMNISEIEDSLLVDTTTLAIRGIEHTRSIAALGHIPVFLDSVTLSMKVQMRKLSRRYLVPATLLGFLGFASFGTWALAFWFGAYTVEEDNCTFENSMYFGMVEIDSQSYTRLPIPLPPCLFPRPQCFARSLRFCSRPFWLASMRRRPLMLARLPRPSAASASSFRPPSRPTLVEDSQAPDFTPALTTMLTAHSRPWQPKTPRSRSSTSKAGYDLRKNNTLPYPPPPLSTPATTAD